MRRFCTCSPVTSGDGDHAAELPAGARRDLFAVSADPSQDRHRACRCRSRHRCRRTGTIVWRDPTRREIRDAVTGGHAKLQWKPDWAMRWYALGVDYEMAGKDLIDRSSSPARSCRALGGDAAGRFQLRIVPRRKGPEDLEVEGQWPDHRGMADLCDPGNPVALHVSEAAAAKRLYFDVIPRTVDDYLGFPRRLSTPGLTERLGNPVWHIHSGKPPAPELHTATRTRHGEQVRHVPQSRRRRQQRRPASPLGLPPSLRAGCLAADASATRRALRYAGTISAISSGPRKTIASRTKSSATPWRSFRPLSPRCRRRQRGRTPDGAL